MEARLADDSRRLRPRLPRHVLAARPGRGRPRGAHPGRSRPIRSPPASPAPRSTATPSWCIRRERLATPLRRIGPKGEGKFAPIGWDEALDEIAARWKAIIAESGPLALLGYAYSAHQGQMNRGLVQRPVPCARHQPAAGRHGLRHLLRDGLGPHGRPGRRRRSRSGRRSPT